MLGDMSFDWGTGMIAILVGSVLACPEAPGVLPASRRVEMVYSVAWMPDGTGIARLGWREGDRFFWRVVDQPSHPIHLASPLWDLASGVCYPADCQPEPPGAMPGFPWTKDASLIGMPE